MTDKFLDKVYEVSGRDATRQLYDEWSDSYDTEVGEHGYKTPRRMAEAIASVTVDREQPILDYGCGTGLLGQELRLQGFATVDGLDPSVGMLEKARGLEMYRNLTLLDLSKELTLGGIAYQTIAACGVISTGAGPASLMDDLINLLPVGGHLSFSLNDHALVDPEYPAGVARLEANGHKKLVEDYGTHLPGLDLSSMVYVFEKT